MQPFWIVIGFLIALIESCFPGTFVTPVDNYERPPPEPYNCEVPVEEDGRRVPRLRIPPRYPQAALAEGVEGRVLLEGEISREGRILNPRIVAAEPSGVFDAAALSAFRDWEYCPLPDTMDLDSEPFRIAVPFRIVNK